MAKKGLAIRCFMGVYCVCDGQPPAGCENDKRGLYIGNVVQWFETREDAVALRTMIDNAYGYEDKE